MVVLILGLLLLVAWAVVAVVLERVWRLWERTPLRRIADIDAAEVVRISGRACARTPNRVLAPLSGAAVLFFSFEGVATVANLRRAARSGQTIVRRAGVPFLVDDGSGLQALVPAPERLRGSATQPLSVLEWSNPEQVAGIERRLGQSLARYQRLQARELVVSEGTPVTLLARAHREGDLIALAPASGESVLLSAATDGSTSQGIVMGRRLLRGLLAAAVLLVVAGGSWVVRGH
jgi:hypothetical protein